MAAALTSTAAVPAPLMKSGLRSELDALSERAVDDQVGAGDGVRSVVGLAFVPIEPGNHLRAG